MTEIVADPGALDVLIAEVNRQGQAIVENLEANYSHNRMATLIALLRIVRGRLEEALAIVDLIGAGRPSDAIKNFPPVAQALEDRLFVLATLPTTDG